MKIIEDLSEEVDRVIFLSKIESWNAGYKEVTPEIIMMGFTRFGDGKNIFGEYSIDRVNARDSILRIIGRRQESFPGEIIEFDERSENMLRRAKGYTLRNGREVIEIPGLVYSLVTEKTRAMDLIWKSLKIDCEDFLAQVERSYEGLRT